EPELLELPREARLHPRPLAQLVELDLFLLRPCPKRAPTPPLGRAWRGELLTDDAQRQELVALEPEDRLQPLDLVLADHPIPAPPPARGEQSLVLEVADLRDRDVRELLLQHPADGPDRQPTSLRSGRAHRFRNVSRYLPIWSSSPSSSSAASTRFRFTNVPLRLPWSSILNVPFLFVRTACLRDTVTSSRKMPQSGDRPIVVSAASPPTGSP